MGTEFYKLLALQMETSYNRRHFIKSISWILAFVSWYLIGHLFFAAPPLSAQPAYRYIESIEVPVLYSPSNFYLLSGSSDMYALYWYSQYDSQVNKYRTDTIVFFDGSFRVSERCFVDFSRLPDSIADKSASVQSIQVINDSLIVLNAWGNLLVMTRSSISQNFEFLRCISLQNTFSKFLMYGSNAIAARFDRSENQPDLELVAFVLDTTGYGYSEKHELFSIQETSGAEFTHSMNVDPISVSQKYTVLSEIAEYTLYIIPHANDGDLIEIRVEDSDFMNRCDSSSSGPWDKGMLISLMQRMNSCSYIEGTRIVDDSTFLVWKRISESDTTARSYMDIWSRRPNGSWGRNAINIKLNQNPDFYIPGMKVCAETIPLYIRNPERWCVANDQIIVFSYRLPWEEYDGKSSLDLLRNEFPLEYPVPGAMMIYSIDGLNRE